MLIQHFGSISGGKDSQAVMCLMRERLDRFGLERFGNMPPRLLAADNGHENPITLDHIAYLSEKWREWTGGEIEICSANDVPGLTDEAAFARKRAMLRDEWSKEKRRKRHGGGCKKRGDCACPIIITKAVPPALIEQAIALLYPTGIPFLDICMLHGQFPGTKSRFCTDETKLIPMMHRKRPLLEDGVDIVEWIGERADESLARRNKRPVQSTRWKSGARQVLYRPIFRRTAADVFEIAKRHGLRPNPLYLMGMSRVGCSTCIMVKKRELRQWAIRFPQEVARVTEWERMVSLVSRYTAANGWPASLLSDSTVPGTGHGRATIDKAIAWANTGKGGRNYDLVIELERRQAEEDGLFCDSEYGLCE